VTDTWKEPGTERGASVKGESSSYFSKSLGYNIPSRVKSGQEYVKNL
jgi:hypothetical protein